MAEGHRQEKAREAASDLMENFGPDARAARAARVEGEPLEIHIRPATVFDSLARAEMMEEEWPNDDPTIDISVHVQAIGRAFDQRVRENNHVFVAECETGVVGTVCIRVRTHYDGAKSARLHDLVVKKEARGRGVGQALVRHVMGAVEKEFGCMKIKLAPRVVGGERLVRFYEKLGFVRETLVAMEARLGAGQ